MKFLYSFFYQIYFQLPPKYDSNSLTYKALSRIIDKCLSWEFNLKKNTEKSIKVDRYVISLTSHGTRVPHVYKSIYCILREDTQPEKVILWLNEADYNDSNLPRKLRKLKNWGIEIRFVKDLGPHTKYYYSFKKLQDYRVLTIDDDKLYPPKFFQRFVENHEHYPDSILCAGARLIPENNGKISYWNWELSWFANNLKDANLLPLGVMGVLYPPSFIQRLDENLLDLGYREFYSTDDLFLKLLSLSYATPIYLVGSWNRGFLNISESKFHHHLMEINLVNNDLNWKKVKIELGIPS